jgi:multidrug resistance efflux pump
MDLEPATLGPEVAASQDDANTTPAKRRRRKLAFFLIFGAAAALASYGIWDVLSESSSTPKN